MYLYVCACFFFNVSIYLRFFLNHILYNLSLLMTTLEKIPNSVFDAVSSFDKKFLVY